MVGGEGRGGREGGGDRIRPVGLEHGVEGEGIPFLNFGDLVWFRFCFYSAGGGGGGF